MPEIKNIKYNNRAQSATGILKNAERVLDSSVTQFIKVLLLNVIIIPMIKMQVLSELVFMMIMVRFQELENIIISKDILCMDLMQLRK